MSKALQIKDFPDYYATNIGNIYTRRSSKKHNPHGRIIKMKPYLNQNGYLEINLYKDGNRHHILVHRIIAETFIPNSENKPQVNHKNGIKNDNRAENLEWATPHENILHMYRSLGYKSSIKGRFGKDNPKTKVVLQIKNKKVIAEFYGIHNAQQQTGINQGHISECCLGKRKSAGGFVWKYKAKGN